MMTEQIFYRPVFLTWKNGFNIPGDEAIDDGIYQHHDHRAQQTEIISDDRTVGHIIPLYTNTLLFILKDVSAAKAKSYRWGQTL